MSVSTTWAGKLPKLHFKVQYRCSPLDFQAQDTRMRAISTISWVILVISGEILTILTNLYEIIIYWIRVWTTSVEESLWNSTTTHGTNNFGFLLTGDMELMATISLGMAEYVHSLGWKIAANRTIDMHHRPTLLSSYISSKSTINCVTNGRLCD